MGKVRKKLSDHVNNKKKHNLKKLQNPFEVHINKQKYEILGRKLKNDRGLPGVSRAKAIRKRKRTLLQEYNLQNKSNKFVDRRIGERNFSLTEEDRKMARFTAERMKHHNKKSIFNLADNEVLTHRGQTLSEIEKFDDPRSDDDEEDEKCNKKSGKLDDSFVDDAHFGGGILQKTGKEGAKTHKDLIEQLIAESKKRKAEKQKTREQTIELTEKLDTEWKDLIPLVNKCKRDDNSDTLQKPDDYDKVMRELKFEARGRPTDRLKSEDEIAKEEKEKLEQLEKERLERMKGFKEVNIKSQHRSADDLDDNFVYESDTEVTLTYNEMGECNVDLKNSVEYTKEKDDKTDEENESDDDSDAEAETEDDLSDLKQDESDSDMEDNIPEEVNIKQNYTNRTPQLNANELNNKKLEIVEKKENTNVSKTEKDSTKSEDKQNIKRKHEDVKQDNWDISSSKKNKAKCLIEDTAKTQIQEDEISNEQKSKSEITKSKLNKKNNSTRTNNNANISNEKDIEDIARDLPYTFALPESYEKLQTILVSHSPQRQNIIIERMIKCNHPSLASSNKANLEKLFIYLLQHINDVAQDCDNIENTKFCFSVMNNLTPHFYTLAQLNPDNARDSLIEVINEKQNEYRRKPKEYPGIDVLLFLKLIRCLFSTSDFRHQVVTPSLIFIGQMLTKCKVKTRYDISYGLFLVTIFIEYTELSKRYMPAALIYVMGILHMAVPKLGVKLLKIIPPFKPNNTLLVLSGKNSTSQPDLKMCSEDFVDVEIEENFQERALNTNLNLIQDLYEHWKHLPSSVEIFEYVLILLKQIPKGNYCKEIQTNIDKVRNNLEEGKRNKKFEYIIAEKKKPKALRLYEPNIQKVFDGKQRRPMSKERAEREKLLHKYKKERKGALREIRRDKSFLGRLKIKQQIQSDQERKEKVKQIYAEASLQQGELNALDRKKKRK